MTSRCCCRENSSSEICWQGQRKASLQWMLCCGPRSSAGAERNTDRDIKCTRDEMIMISRLIHYSSLAEVVSTVAEEGLTTVGFLVSDTTVICVNPANRCLKPVLNWVNVCSQLACNEMQASARTCGRRAADSMIENAG